LAQFGIQLMPVRRLLVIDPALVGCAVLLGRGEFLPCNGLQEGEHMADDDALFQKGMPIRREVLGPEYVDASMARADEFMMSFQRATTAWAWGWAWGDATLDRKTRSLMNLAMLTALNRAPEIKLHVKGALNNGVTVEEIKAALLHATA
jgi:4-carboxymuconolactone decarboxylase